MDPMTHARTYCVEIRSWGRRRSWVGSETRLAALGSIASLRGVSNHHSAFSDSFYAERGSSCTGLIEINGLASRAFSRTARCAGDKTRRRFAPTNRSRVECPGRRYPGPAGL